MTRKIITVEPEVTGCDTFSVFSTFAGESYKQYKKKVEKGPKNRKPVTFEPKTRFCKPVTFDETIEVRP